MTCTKEEPKPIFAPPPPPSKRPSPTLKPRTDQEMNVQRLSANIDMTRFEIDSMRPPPPPPPPPSIPTSKQFLYPMKGRAFLFLTTLGWPSGKRLVTDITKMCEVSGSIPARHRQDDDKWEHDLYEQPDPQVSNRRVGVRDLRSILQKKSANGSLSGGVRDLREKLSGYSQSAVSAPAKAKPVSESSRPARRSVLAEAAVAETRNVSGPASKRKKAETVDSFLKGLGLEKYCIQFQAEEVDMTALQHITDEDLKAIGIPMYTAHLLQ
ncbi:ankyrin repeat and SAM domain-containing protein 6 [Tanacetum coccineum]